MAQKDSSRFGYWGEKRAENKSIYGLDEPKENREVVSLNSDGTDVRMKSNVSARSPRRLDMRVGEEPVARGC